MFEKVAIIGGGSFTAHWLEKELIARSFCVSSSQRSAQVDGNFLDLNDENSFQSFFNKNSPSVVILLAGISRSTGNVFLPYFQANVVGAHNLVKYIVNNVKSVNHIIFASTAHVYGSVVGDAISEVTTCQPVTNYGYSKLIAEKLLVEMAGDKLTIVRPFNYTGVRQSADFIIPKLVHAFATNLEVIRLGNIWPIRDFSDVRDIACSYANIVEKRIIGALVNLSSGEGTSLSDVLKHLSEISGHFPRIETAPELIRDEVAVQIGCTNLSSSLGCRSRNFTIYDTLDWMYASMLNSASTQS